MRKKKKKKAKTLKNKYVVKAFRSPTILIKLKTAPLNGMLNTKAEDQRKVSF